MSTIVKSNPTSNFELIKQLNDFFASLNPTYTDLGAISPTHQYYKLLMSIRELQSLFSVTYPLVHQVNPDLHFELTDLMTAPKTSNYLFGIHVCILQLIKLISTYKAKELAHYKFYGR
jgi:hypothetical protein